MTLVEEKKVAAGKGWVVTALLVASAGAVIPGYLNTQVRPLHDHLSVEAMLAIGILSTIAGALCPRVAWKSAILIGLGLPAVHLAIALFGIRVPRPLPPQFSDLIALIPAFLCCAAGAGWRLFFTQPLAKPPRHN